MGGVDLSDQMRQYYCVRLKCRKFYKYIFWFTFEVALNNAYILFRSAHQNDDTLKRFNYLKFRGELAKELIGTYNSRKIRGRPSHTVTPSVTSPSFLKHFPVKADKRSKCSFCYRKKSLKWTQWICKECGKYFCHTGKPESDCYMKTHA